MSGAEATFVIGIISSVITIIEATKTVYDAAKDARGQPEAFRQVAARLPLVTEILHNTRERAKTLDENAQDALEPILESCKTKAEKLNKLFQKVVRKDDDKWYDRYKKAVGTLGKEGQVERLMEGILKDVQVLACERLMGTATDTQVGEIKEAIKEMNEMPSSLPDETGGAIHQQHSGSSENYGHVRTVNRAAGDFYQSHNTSPVTFGNNPQNAMYNVTKSTLWMVPRQPNTFFTGQKSVLSKLQSKLCNGNPLNDSIPRRFAITGIGGAGKSEVCLKFASIHRDRFRGVFWIDASSALTVERGYIIGAKLYGVSGDYQSAKSFFDNLKDPYLLVLDNADDIKLGLNPYLPSAITSTTLITSRNDKIERYATSGTETLEKFEMEDATELLLKASAIPETKPAEKRAETEAVVQLLTQHALAVVQAGAFIAQDLCTLEEYPTEYKRQRKQLLEFHDDQANSTYSDVYATFEVSLIYLEYLKPKNQSHADVLELL